jgi:hypothetical protein
MDACIPNPPVPVCVLKYTQSKERAEYFQEQFLHLDRVEEQQAVFRIHNAPPFVLGDTIVPKLNSGVRGTTTRIPVPRVVAADERLFENERRPAR